MTRTAGGVCYFLDQLGESTGHLVIFDCSARSWEEKIYQRVEEYTGRPITVWGM